MRKSWFACLLAGALVASPAFALNGPKFVEVDLFATLPAGVQNPEGIAANPATGDIFAATFDVRSTGANNKLMRFAKDGHLAAMKDFGGQPMLGLEFRNGQVYILNFGLSQLQRIPANFDASTPVETVAMFPSIGSPGSRNEPNPDGSQDTITFGSNGFPAANAMVFDSAGNLFVSDSFQGAIFEIANATTCATPCAVTTVTHDPKLATAGFPPFGANGLAFSADQKTMFIANTGDDRVLAMDMATHAISTFAESINGADGVLFHDGLVWVCANQADEVVALNANGRPVVHAGFFAGIRNDGQPVGLLFPASPVVVGNDMFVTNLAIALTPAVGDEPEEDVKIWTISRFKIPK